MKGMDEFPTDVLAFAVNKEIEARALYVKLSEAVDDPELTALLAGLAADEERHRRLLEDHYGDPHLERYPQPQPRPEDGGVTFAGPVTLVSVLDRAIEAEEKARAFYADYAGRAADPLASKMFAELAAEEEKHRDLLSSEIRSRQGQPWDTYELDNWVRDD
jgi:rubrerythrin